MEIVLDANVLFRTLISHGDIVFLFFHDSLQLIAPVRLREEFLRHKREILEKSSLTESEFEEFVVLLFDRIKFIDFAKYSSCIPKAKELLGTHEKDEDFIALCIMKNTKLWTYEKRLFDIGYGISTKEISTQLGGLQ